MLIEYCQIGNTSGILVCMYTVHMGTWRCKPSFNIPIHNIVIHCQSMSVMCNSPAGETCWSYMCSFCVQLENSILIHYIDIIISLIFNNDNKTTRQKERERERAEHVEGRTGGFERETAGKTGANPRTQKSSIFHWGGTRRAAPVGAPQKLSTLPI